MSKILISKTFKKLYGVLYGAMQLQRGCLCFCRGWYFSTLYL